MKSLNKLNNRIKSKILSSSVAFVYNQPIKCQKIVKQVTYNVPSAQGQLPNHLSKDLSINTKNKNKKTKDDKAPVPGTSTRMPISIKCQSRQGIENSQFIFKDKASVNIDMSQSYVKNPVKPQVITLPPNQINNSNCNSITRNDHISNYLNYNLGDTKNFTNLDEIGLDTNKNVNLRSNSRELEFNNDTPTTNELEIELSKASVKFDSLMIESNPNCKQASGKDKSPLHLFPNNSVYYLDTNEFDEGEEKNSIYTLTTQENLGNFKPEYCLTENNINHRQTNYPKKDRNLKNKQLNIVETSDSNTHFKKLTLNNLSKSNRSYIRFSRKKI